MADGDIQGVKLLAHSPWTQWLTWVFQVMPVFFVAGGYSNATSRASASRNGDGHGRWLVARMRRLMIPVIPLAAVWALFGIVLSNAGIDEGLLRMGSQSAIIPVWFLAVFVVMLAGDSKWRWFARCRRRPAAVRWERRGAA